MSSALASLNGGGVSFVERRGHRESRQAFFSARGQFGEFTRRGLGLTGHVASICSFKFMGQNLSAPKLNEIRGKSKPPR